MTVDLVWIPTIYPLSDEYTRLDAQADVLRLEAARVFAFERTQRAALLSQSSREELAIGAALPRQRYLEALALIARCRVLFAQAIAPFDLFWARARRAKRRWAWAIQARQCSTG